MNFLHKLFGAQQDTEADVDSEASPALADPLWALMLSTNDCPGCGCEYDKFEMTVERVNDWLDEDNWDKLQEAERLLDELIATPKLPLRKIRDQNRICFTDANAARAWLQEWKDLLRQVAAAQETTASLDSATNGSPEGQQD